MPPTLTPLPSPKAGIADRPATTSAWNVLPFPSPVPLGEHKPAGGKLPVLPATPTAAVESTAPGTADFPSSWPSPITALPSVGRTLPVEDPGDVPLPSIPFFGTPPPADFAIPETSVATTANKPAEPATGDFTDDDLADALAPVMARALGGSLPGGAGSDPDFEPLLRATIRRSLAEYSPASRRPFQPPGAFDRFVWHLKALFTSRTYEDILFEKTRRFQIEEVFLLDADTLALVSFASCDPARHSSVRRISGTAQRLALELRDDDGSIRPVVELSAQRRLLAVHGRHVVLMALVRGQPGDLVTADLDFTLRRIERYYDERFLQEGSSLLFELQPFLEDCLLIQAPASAA